MALAPGTRIGPYEIAARIGVGGMGEVYRAVDTKLKRSVAVKVLPDDVASDVDRLARFQREAEVLASLNHPNIAQIHGLEEAPSTRPGQPGVRALVMELVEGSTLEDRIAEGPIPVGEALAIARQMAEALEAAHEKSVVHRDLKPANVKVTPEGIVKVLDFGLAKALESRPVGATVGDGNSETQTVPVLVVTMPGMVMGTPAYMSPEQARGGAVDRRADIWAFGCLLYEMLTGRRAFPGATISDVLAAVLEREPDFAILPAATPPGVRRVLRRCLEKDLRARLRDMGDVRLELEDAQTTSTEMRATASRKRGMAITFCSLGLIVGALAAGGATWAWRTPAPTRMVRLNASPHADGLLTGRNGLDPDVAISADGARIVFLTGSPGAQQLYVRELDQREARRIEGPGRAPRGPFLSPDGTRVGFFEGRALKTVAVNGGPVVTVCEIDGDPRGASWGSDDAIVFATSNPDTGLFRVAASGGAAAALTMANGAGRDADPRWPEILPGGEEVLFTLVPSGTIDAAQLGVVNTRTGETKTLLRGGSHPRYVRTGHILYGMAGTLWAVAFDADTLTLRSDPVPVVQGVVTKPRSGAASFSVAANGSLVYLTGGSPGVETLSWVDRQGQEVPLTAPPRAYFSPRLAPDGTRVAIGVAGQETDVWILDLARSTLTLLTADPGTDTGPVWTPDSKRIAFGSNRAGATNLFWQPADGTGAAERLVESGSEQSPQSFSPDGKRLVFLDIGPDNDLHMLSLADGTKQPLLVNPFFTREAEVSPDGLMMAYVSNESGAFEVSVRAFPDVNAKGTRQVSSGGGTHPAWNPNGHELFYVSPQGAMMAVPVRLGPATIEMGTATRLFDWPFAATSGSRSYDVSTDGRRFLMVTPARSAGQRAAQQEIEVVLNWFEELTRLVPAR